jgi:hypothetical protein
MRGRPRPFFRARKGPKIRLIEEDVDAIRRQAEGLSGSSEYSNSMAPPRPQDGPGMPASAEFGRMRNLIPEAGAVSSTR